MIFLTAEAWRRNARCAEPEVDPDLFFPVEREGKIESERRTRAAKRLCNGCMVQAECLDEGMRSENLHREAGVYGGVSAITRMSRAGATEPTFNGNLISV